MSVTAEHKLLLTRGGSAKEILKGLTVAAGGLFLVWLLSCRLDNLWVLILAAAPLGYGWHLIALAWDGLFRRVISNAPGTARWGTLDDLQNAGQIGEGNRSRDFYCGLFDGKPVYYSGDRHIVTIGATRRGKDSGLLVPNLSHLRESAVILDPKGEAACITAEERRKQGPTIFLNPFRVKVDERPDLASMGFNPLAVGFHPKEPNYFEKAMAFAEIMVPIPVGTRDVHWLEGGRELDCCLLMIDGWRAFEAGVQATFGSVNKMLRLPFTSKNPKADTLQKEIEKAVVFPHDEQVRELANRFTSNDDDDREINGVIQTARTQLKFLISTTLKADLAKHPTVAGRPFDFEMLKYYGPTFAPLKPGQKHNGEVITVYVILPEDMFETHAVWLRLIVGSAFNALKRSGPGDVTPLLILNEIGSLGRIQSIQTAMAMLAANGARVWSLWQNYAQGVTVYGQHGFSSFLSGAGVVNSFGADDDETAEMLSKRLGPRTEVVSSYTTGTSSNGSTDNSSTSKNEHSGGYPLMHPNQIMGMPERELISWIDRRPYKLTAPHYLNLPWVKGMRRSPYGVKPKKRAP